MIRLRNPQFLGSLNRQNNSAQWNFANGPYPQRPTDDLTSYTSGADLNDLNGGAFWQYPYTAKPYDASDWAAQVVASGGATPSDNTVSAIHVFLSALRSANIFSKMQMINVFAPDSVTAAMVPLIQNGYSGASYGGSVPWTRTGGADSLTVNGYSPSAAGRLVTSTLVSTSIFNADNSAGASVIHADGATDGMYFGANNAFSTCFFIQKSVGTLTYCCWTLATPQAFTYTHATGFYSFSRTTDGFVSGYSADSGTAFGQRVSTSIASGVRTGIGTAVTVFDMAPNFSWNMGANRLSFMAWHYGLTSSETEALFDAAYTMRNSFGGGAP